MLFDVDSSARILLLAPHTDDIEIAAGGLVHKAAIAGAEIFYVAFSDCRESVPDGFEADILREECCLATTSLGIPLNNVIIKEYKVRRFSEYRQEILEELIKYRKKIRPNIIITPSLKDIHQDHQVIAMESLRAFKNSTILAYQFDWNCFETSRNFFVELNEANIKAKVDALAKYKSQQSKPYFQKNFIVSHASVIGRQFGFDYAEGFELVRMVLSDA